MVVSVFTEVGIGICLLGMIVGIAGLIIGGLKLSKNPFSVANFDDGYIWIRGADESVTRMFEPLKR